MLWRELQINQNDWIYDQDANRVCLYINIFVIQQWHKSSVLSLWLSRGPLQFQTTSYPFLSLARHISVRLHLSCFNSEPLYIPCHQLKENNLQTRERDSDRIPCSKVWCMTDYSQENDKRNFASVGEGSDNAECISCCSNFLAESFPESNFLRKSLSLALLVTYTNFMRVQHSRTPWSVRTHERQLNFWDTKNPFLLFCLL